MQGGALPSWTSILIALLMGLTPAAAAGADPSDDPAARDGAEAPAADPDAGAARPGAGRQPQDQPAPPEPARPKRKRNPSEFWLPFGSVLLPGLGQYLQGAPRAGLAFTGAAVGGYVLGATADGAASYDGDLPRGLEGQAGLLGLQVAFDAGLVSAYDSFHRSMPALRERGRYEFLATHEPTGRLFDAPFEFSYLRRKRTWIPLLVVGALAGSAVLADRGAGADPGQEFVPFEVHDPLFAAAVSYNAGVAEEAFFRGWLLPVLHQRSGGKYWLANSLQALLFAGAHYSEDNRAPWPQLLFGLYQGHVTRKNGGSVRESIFQHVWYDVIVISAVLLTETQDRQPLRIGIRLRF
jgi:membrane protease YdiL (CAAX protease family)